MFRSVISADRLVGSGMVEKSGSDDSGGGVFSWAMAVHVVPLFRVTKSLKRPAPSGSHWTYVSPPTKAGTLRGTLSPSKPVGFRNGAGSDGKPAEPCLLKSETT